MIARKITTAKRSKSLAALNATAEADKASYFAIVAVRTPWASGVLRIIRTVAGSKIPAAGTDMRLTNAVTRLALGEYRVITLPDAIHGQPIPVWNLVPNGDDKPAEQTGADALASVGIHAPKPSENVSAAAAGTAAAGTVTDTVKPTPATVKPNSSKK